MHVMKKDQKPRISFTFGLKFFFIPSGNVSREQFSQHLILYYKSCMDGSYRAEKAQ
jgi:hypothetical protein